MHKLVKTIDRALASFSGPFPYIVPLSFVNLNIFCYLALRNKDLIGFACVAFMIFQLMLYYVSCAHIVVAQEKSIVIAERWILFWKFVTAINLVIVLVYIWAVLG
jgi:hypothetical protein